MSKGFTVFGTYEESGCCYTGHEEKAKTWEEAQALTGFDVTVIAIIEGSHNDLTGYTYGEPGGKSCRVCGVGWNATALDADGKCIDCVEQN